MLFVSWFVSGIVMMYARMPGLRAEERLMRLPALDLSTARVAPAEAWQRATNVMADSQGRRPEFQAVAAYAKHELLGQ